jgi:endoglucanase
MLRRAARLVAWIALAGVGGCRENVYLGNPIGLQDHLVPEGGPTDAPPPPPDGPPFPWYLHTRGSKILDSNDGVVALRGINWAGMQGLLRVPDGLHARTIESFVQQIQDLGFNLIRIPVSSESIQPNSMPTAITMTDPLLANPDLAGSTSLQVLDAIINAAYQHRIRVILDRYRFRAGDTGPPPPTWYSNAFPQTQWMSDWTMLATRYAKIPSMVGCDLHDEPGNPSTWGDGNVSTDWRAAAERTGNQILAVNPNLVIFIEGVEGTGGAAYWPGGNLRNAGNAPVQLTSPNKLIYSIHEYGKSINTAKPWFADPSYPNNLQSLWDANWGQLVQSDTTPVVIGAFADRKGDVTPDIADADQKWRDALMSYIATNQLGYVFWALNPSAEGKSGLLKAGWNQGLDPEWQSELKLP